jgi:hypothetical protein
MSMQAGTTNTGLDKLVDLIASNSGLQNRLTSSQRNEALQSIDALNKVIIEAIKTTGIANDGIITGGDLVDINRYIKANGLAAFNNNIGEPGKSGFGLALDASSTQGMFGSNGVRSADAVKHVANGFSLLGGEFDTERGIVLREDGTTYRRLPEVAGWLNELLAADIKAGRLDNPALDFLTVGTTGTDLDLSVEEIVTKRSLAAKVAGGDREIAARAADRQNELILEAIFVTGVAKDGNIDAGEARLINEYLNFNYLDEWTVEHGAFRNGERSGWHLVVDISKSEPDRIFGVPALDYFWDGLYHIGFDVRDGRLTNARGELNVSFELVSRWLNFLLEDEYKSGYFNRAANMPDIPDGVVWPTGRPLDANYGDAIPSEYFHPSVKPNNATGTSLDLIVDLLNSRIAVEGRLSRTLGTEPLEEAAAAVETMNKRIVAAFDALKIDIEDGLSRNELLAVNDYLVGRHNDWRALKSKIEVLADEGQGFVYIMGERAIKVVMNGIYNIGLPMGDRFSKNADGKNGANINKIEAWLNGILEQDGRTASPPSQPIYSPPPQQPVENESPGGPEMPKGPLTGVVLVDADSNAEVIPLVDGMVLSAARLGLTGFNVVATSGVAETSQLQSVAFQLSGPVSATRIENAPPYAVFGDVAGNFVGETLLPGTYTLSATPYTGNGATGKAGAPLLVTFTVEAGGERGALLHAVNAGGKGVQGFDDTPDGIAIDLTADNGSFLAGGGDRVAGPAALGGGSTVVGSHRWDSKSGPEMLWKFPVEAGTPVVVDLYFAEFQGLFTTESRPFDVSIEGDKVLDDFDIFAEAGFQNLTVQSFEATVGDDGTLDILFERIDGGPSPIVAAIAVYEAETLVG